MREWVEVSVAVPAEAADAVSERLVALGAPGVIEEDAGAGETRLRVHFPASREPQALALQVDEAVRAVGEFFPGCGALRAEVRTVADEDWAEGWKQNFPIIDVGRLRVRTPWAPHADDGRLEIEILPAMAFGTGQHASTLGCLLALGELADAEGDLASVLDVGTGSGILALAAARLGAGRILGIDNDPVAVEAARENVGRNALAEIVQIEEGTVESIRESFSIVVANLYSGLLRELFPELARVARPAATLVVAGLLDADRDAVSASARAAGWIERGARSIDGWTTIVFGRES